MMMYRPIRNSLLVCCALLIGCHSDKARQKADFTENDATAVVRNLLRSEGADLAGIEISAKRDPDGGMARWRRLVCAKRERRKTLCSGGR